MKPSSLINFGALFHAFSKDKTMRGAIDFRHGFNEVTPPERKRYGMQFTRIPLPVPQTNETLDSLTHARASVRSWSTTPLSLAELSPILHFGCGYTNTDGIGRRVYGSGGGRYPLEVYVVNFLPGELKTMVYHYEPETHTLVELWPVSVLSEQERNGLFSQSYPWAKEAPCAIFITGVTHRTVSRYGELAYRFLYLEAGAVAHTMHLLGSIHGLGSTILGGVHDAPLEALLDIDGEDETFLISVLLGKVV